MGVRMATAPDEQRFPSTTLVILVADIAGYARVFRTRSDAEVAAFLDRFYRACEVTTTELGGRIIKFMGDAVLAVFHPSHVGGAVAAAVTLQRVVKRLAEDVGLELDLGASVHLGAAVEGEFGSGSSRRRDVVGRTVNQTFLMGRGPGIRISEPVFRRLPSSERSPWTKNRPPVLYSLGEAGELYTGLGKTVLENALRW